MFVLRALETLLLKFRVEYDSLISVNSMDNEIIGTEDKLLLKYHVLLLAEGFLQ